MEHGADEFDRWRLIWILLLEMHHESESAVFKRGVGGADDDGVPIDGSIVLAIPII